MFGELIENLEFFRKHGIRYMINAQESIVSIEIGFENFTTRYTIQPKAESWQIELIVQEGFGRKILQKEFETFSKAFEEVVDDMAKIKQQFLGETENEEEE